MGIFLTLQSSMSDQILVYLLLSLVQVILKDMKYCDSQLFYKLLTILIGMSHSFQFYHTHKSFFGGWKSHAKHPKPSPIRYMGIKCLLLYNMGNSKLLCRSLNHGIYFPPWPMTFLKWMHGIEGRACRISDTIWTQILVKIYTNLRELGKACNWTVL